MRRGRGQENSSEFALWHPELVLGNRMEDPPQVFKALDKLRSGRGRRNGELIISS